MNKIRVLLVADVLGHILERIAKSWIRNSNTVHHELICSAENHPFLINIRGYQIGLIHWIDPLVYRVFGSTTLVPQVVMVHHATDQELHDTIKSLKYCDGITTVSRRWKIKLEALIDREVILIPNTVDSKQFNILNDNSKLRMEHNIPVNSFVLGFVGKVGANAFGRKGINIFLDVLRESAQIWKDLSVLLIGPGWEDLTRQITAMGINVYRYEVKTTEDTASLYPLMDTLLVTSSEEGGPCTILEAMSCGVPVITSDVGHVPEVVHDCETGFVCPTRSIGEYIDRIKTIRDNDVLRNKIIVKARIFIERERDERVAIPKIDFVGLYSKAIAYYQKRLLTYRVARILPFSYLAARFAAATARKMLFDNCRNKDATRLD